MATYLAGVIFLVACVLGIPIVRRILHERALRTLGMDGVTVVPGFWRLGGLHLKRARWEGRVTFESSGVGANERPGHIRFLATLAAPAPLEKQLLEPRMRERLQDLEKAGGRVSAIGEAALQIDGPLTTRLDDLKSFLQRCDAVVEGTLA